MLASLATHGYVNTDNTEYSDLPWPSSNPFLRLNAIAPYYTMFPLNFPYRHLTAARPGEWVLDPFCGRGTTNFAARLLGLSSVGIDSNPVAVAIARAKLVAVTAEEVTNAAEELLEVIREPSTVPSGPFWELAYHEKTLEDLCRLREGLLRESSLHLQASPEARVALRALLLGILHGPLQKGVPSYLSNQMPRTYATKPEAAVRFWRSRGLQPAYVKVLEVIARRARHTFASLPPKTEGSIIEGDSQSQTLFSQMPQQRFSWVITSPPYLGMRMYLPDQWLRLWFLGGPSTVKYDYNQQVGYLSLEKYLTGLSRVWGNVATVSRPGARLVIRFGALPSLACDPLSVLQESLERSGAAWRVVEVKTAGIPARSKRQADQFLRQSKKPLEEIDLLAVLAT